MINILFDKNTEEFIRELIRNKADEIQKKKKQTYRKLVFPPRERLMIRINFGVL